MPGGNNRPTDGIMVDINNMQTQNHVTGVSAENESSSNMIELPIVKANVFGTDYTCLLDSGSTHTVMNQDLFLQIKQKMPKLQCLPTCGLFCTLAVGARKNKVRGQVLLPIKINNEVYEIIFLIIPHLSVNFILGAETLYKWRAILDFGRKQMKIHVLDRVKEIPFITKDQDSIDLGSPAEREILEGAFFIEHLSINGRVANVLELNDSHDSQLFAQGCNQQPFCDGCEQVAWCHAPARQTGLDTCTIQLNHLSTDTESYDIDTVIMEKTEEAVGITEYQRCQLYDVLNKNKELFANRIGRCTSYTHSFTVTDLAPFCHKSRPIPAPLVEKVDREINRMVSEGIITVANSRYVSPLCIVVKKDQSVRVTLDCRQLNSKCLPDHFNNRNVEQLLRKVTGSKFLTRFDFRSAYWQLPLDPRCTDYVAFLHQGVQYKFLVCPFGQSTSGAALLRALHNIFKEELQTFIACFSDDFLLHSDDFDTHLKHIDIVMTKLRENGFTVKPGKTHFIQPEIEFLGFIVSEVGVRPNPAKIKSIMEISAPRNVKQLRRFLGICAYQARFLINYAAETEPLRRLIKKNVKWEWTETQAQAFENVKRLFANSVLLARPDYARPFVIFCDASFRGLSGILTQEDDEGNCTVISTTSRGLSSTEKRLYPTELEICAVYHALQRFRDYIFNHRVIIRSDAISLSFIRNCKLTSSRISRFVHEIMAFDVQIEYIKGTENIFADLLSRLPRNLELQKSIDFRDQKECVIMKLSGYTEVNLSPMLKNLPELQKQDATIAEIMKDAPVLGNEKNSKFAVKDNILYKLDGRIQPVWKTYIPSVLEEDLILNFHHGLGHAGINRTVLAIQEHLYLKRLGNKVRKIVSKCDLCQRAKQLSAKYDVSFQSILRDQPRALICTDVHGPLPVGRFGHKYILIVTDVFSKFVKIYPMKAITTASCLKKIQGDFIETYGPIQSILSDNASYFSSPKWRQAFESTGTRVYHSSAYFASGNPSERQLKEVTTYLRIFCNRNHKSWYDYCAVIEKIMNRSPHGVTQMTPEFLFTGTKAASIFQGIPPSIPVPNQEELDLYKLAYQRLVKRAEQRKAKAKRRKRKWDPQINEKVLVRNHQLSSRLKNQYFRMHLLFKGPFFINQKFGDHTFELRGLKDGKMHGRVHKQFLKRYRE